MTTSGSALATASPTAVASRPSTTAGSAPSARSCPALAGLLVVAVTWCPCPASWGSSCRPTAPAAPATKTRMLTPSENPFGLIALRAETGPRAVTPADQQPATRHGQTTARPTRDRLAASCRSSGEDAPMPARGPQQPGFRLGGGRPLPPAFRPRDAYELHLLPPWPAAMCGAPGLGEARVVSGGWFCKGRYEPALPWASPEGAQPGGIFRGTKVPPALTRGALADRFPRPGVGLGAAGRADLAEEEADVFLDGAGGDHQLARDAPVTPCPRPPAAAPPARGRSAARPGPAPAAARPDRGRACVPRPGPRPLCAPPAPCRSNEQARDAVRGRGTVVAFADGGPRGAPRRARPSPTARGRCPGSPRCTARRGRRPRRERLQHVRAFHAADFHPALRPAGKPFRAVRQRFPVRAHPGRDELPHSSHGRYHVTLPPLRSTGRAQCHRAYAVMAARRSRLPRHRRRGHSSRTACATGRSCGRGGRHGVAVNGVQPGAARSMTGARWPRARSVVTKYDSPNLLCRASRSWWICPADPTKIDGIAHTSSQVTPLHRRCCMSISVSRRRWFVTRKVAKVLSSSARNRSPAAASSTPSFTPNLLNLDLLEYPWIRRRDPNLRRCWTNYFFTAPSLADTLACCRDLPVVQAVRQPPVPGRGSPATARGPSRLHHRPCVVAGVRTGGRAGARLGPARLRQRSWAAERDGYVRPGVGRRHCTGVGTNLAIASATTAGLSTGTHVLAPGTGTSSGSGPRARRPGRRSPRPRSGRSAAPPGLWLQPHAPAPRPPPPRTRRGTTPPCRQSGGTPHPW